MNTYARVIDGIVLDPVLAISTAEALNFFPYAPDDWVFQEVPEGTMHGAKDNGDGTFTNPEPPTQITYQTMEKIDFMDHVYACLGGGLDGIAAFGAILMEARASTDPMVVAAMERYASANTFNRDESSVFLDILVAASDVTFSQAQKDKIIADWPMDGEIR